MRNKQITPIYSFFCEMKWRKSGAHINCLFHFVLIFSTALPNQRYHDSKTLNRSVLFIGFFILPRGYLQALVFLVLAFYWSSVLKYALYNYWGLRRKITNVTDRVGTLSYSLICEVSWIWSGAYINCLFCFVLSFSTAVPNRHYCDSKALRKSVVCIGLRILLSGA